MEVYIMNKYKKISKLVICINLVALLIYLISFNIMAENTTVGDSVILGESEVTPPGSSEGDLPEYISVKDNSNIIVLKEYVKNNSQFKIIELQVNQKRIDYKKYSNKIEEYNERKKGINNSIQSSKDRKQKYHDAGNILGELNEAANIENYEQQLKQLNDTLNTVQLQSSLLEQYMLEPDKIIKKQYEDLKLSLYKKYLQLYLDQINLNYYQKAIDEIKAKCKIEETKLKQGYSIKAQLTSINSSLETATTQFITLKNKNDYEKREFSNACGINDYVIEINDDYQIKTLDEYIQSFNQNSLVIPILEVQIKAYEKYLSNCQEEILDKTNTEYQLEILKLQLIQYRNDLPLYVENYYTELNNMLEQIKTKKLEIVALDQSIAINNKLYENGKVQHVVLDELSTQKQKMQYELSTFQYKASIYYYILQNCVEEQSINSFGL